MAETKNHRWTEGWLETWQTWRATWWMLTWWSWCPWHWWSPWWHPLSSSWDTPAHTSSSHTSGWRRPPPKYRQDCPWEHCWGPGHRLSKLFSVLDNEGIVYEVGIYDLIYDPLDAVSLIPGIGEVADGVILLVGISEFLFGENTQRGLMAAGSSAQA